MGRDERVPSHSASCMAGRSRRTARSGPLVVISMVIGIITTVAYPAATTPAALDKHNIGIASASFKPRSMPVANNTLVFHTP